MMRMAKSIGHVRCAPPTGGVDDWPIGDLAPTARRTAAPRTEPTPNARRSSCDIGRWFGARSSTATRRHMRCADFRRCSHYLLWAAARPACRQKRRRPRAMGAFSRQDSESCLSKMVSRSLDLSTSNSTVTGTRPATAEAKPTRSPDTPNPNQPHAIKPKPPLAPTRAPSAHSPQPAAAAHRPEAPHG